MKRTKWVLLLMALTLGPLTACTQGGNNSSTAKNSGAPVASPTVAPAYPGAVDRMDCTVIAGWVVDRLNPDSETKVALLIDDKLIETMAATRMREDLKSWGSGKHGFVFRIPAALKDGSKHTFKVKVDATNDELPLVQTPPYFVCNPS